MRRWLSVFFLFLLCACSIQIYDLQPVIPITNTPEQRIASPTLFVARTKGPYTRNVTNTPPLHIAPTQITVAVPVYITDLTMADGGNGWAVGQIPQASDKIILRTTDGGDTWRNLTPPQAIYDNTGKNMEVSAKFLDANHAWVLFWEPDQWNPQNGVTVWSTSDGGANWEGTALPITGYTMRYFREPQIGFLDSQIGWIMASLGENADRSYYAVYTTFDGGKTWSVPVTSDSANLPARGKKNGVVFRNALEGWVTGVSTREEPGAFLWKTVDGGNTWGQQTLPRPELDGVPADLLANPSYSCSLSVPEFTDFQFQYAWTILSCTGETLPEPISVIYWSYDALSTWRYYKLPKYGGTAAFYGIDVGWYVQTADAGDSYNYEIMTTSNGGQSWNLTAKTMWSIEPRFITASVGFGVAVYRDVPYLMKTSTGGYSWEQVQAVVVP